MKTTDYSNLSMDEIVFEQRNKQYGAYALREQYGHNILKAILITLSVFLLALFISLLMNKIDLLMTALANACKEETAITPTEIPGQELVKIIDPPGGNPDAGPKNASGFIITPEGPAKTDTSAVNTNPEGPQTGGSGSDLGGGSGTGGNGGAESKDTAAAIIPEKPTKFDPIEQMPEFKGGDLTKWIEEELSQPDEESGTAIVNFTVNEEGRVTNIKIKKSSGYESLDREAKRVVYSLSKLGFTPGRQRGKPVSVDYEIPISFTLDE